MELDLVIRELFRPFVPIGLRTEKMILARGMISSICRSRWELSVGGTRGLGDSLYVEETAGRAIHQVAPRRSKPKLVRIDPDPDLDMRATVDASVDSRRQHSGSKSSPANEERRIDADLKYFSSK